MATTKTKARHSAGTSSGGRFAETRHDEADVELGGTGSPSTGAQADCGDCGNPTKRSSGLCRKCDPSVKARRDAKPARTKGPVAGVEKDKSSGPVLDREAGSLTEDEIGQCAYGFVPVFRGGQRSGTSTRDCKNAVKIPGSEMCHQHGGEPESSLGRTVAKARAEAGRGECFPLATEHWDAADQRLALAQGQLLNILDTDTTAMAAAFVAWRNQLGDTPSRFSVNNQFMVLVQHYMAERRNSDFDDLDDESRKAAWAAAVEASSEPHMTKTAWAKLGRQPDDDAQGVAVVWWQPGGKIEKKEDEDTKDEDGNEADEPKRSYRGKHGSLMQFPLSATNGDHYEVAADPIASYRPSGFGDTAAAMETMRGLADDMGIKVEVVDDRPPEAVAYWEAARSRIVVWKGIGGGDERALVHVMAHELGHARLGHSTDAQKEDRTNEKEMAAESFAALVCAHHGVDASELSATYVEDWRRGAGIDMTAAGTGPLRSAVEAFDDYVTATSPASA